MTAPGSRFAWVLNLDAELELARPDYRPNAKLRGLLEHYARLAVPLLGPEDVVVAAGFRSSTPFVGRAWCPTAQAVATLRQVEVEPEPHPDVQVLRRVNHRRFAFELGGGLPGAVFVEDSRTLIDELLSKSQTWLLKRPFGFAGRGQLRVRESIADDQWPWIEASLSRGGLLVEPLVYPAVEFALHGFIWQSGQFELGRPCVQRVSPRGVWQSTELVQSGSLRSSERAALFEHGERAAQALSGVAYFGPFGIDAYRYELYGKTGFCSLGEINARYTMGFRTGFPKPPWELSLA